MVVRKQVHVEADDDLFFLTLSLLISLGYLLPLSAIATPLQCLSMGLEFYLTSDRLSDGVCCQPAVSHFPLICILFASPAMGDSPSLRLHALMA